MRELLVSGIKFRTNSDLFSVAEMDGEQALVLRGNTYSDELDDFTGKVRANSRGGKVALATESRTNYVMHAEMKFLACNIGGFSSGGWFGFAIRAQDFDNYETVWFMPGGGGESNTVAYVPVAHGVVPWWTEAYEKQTKGIRRLPSADWFRTRVEVLGDEFSVFVEDELVLRKTMTYYLTSGMAGLFVGTATDVAFRRIRIEEIANS